ncbi:hypothetical protein CR513_59385, partial [Mucuna pruriens]
MVLYSPPCKISHLIALANGSNLTAKGIGQVREGGDMFQVPTLNDNGVGGGGFWLEAIELGLGIESSSGYQITIDEQKKYISRVLLCLCLVTKSRHLGLLSPPPSVAIYRRKFLSCLVCRELCHKTQKVSRLEDLPLAPTRRSRGSSLPAREHHASPSKPSFFVATWSDSVELWFWGQGFHDNLEKQEAEIPEENRAPWLKLDYQLCAILWQSTCYSFWMNARDVFANDVQRLFDSTQKITNHDMVSHIAKARATTE